MDKSNTRSVRIPTEIETKPHVSDSSFKKDGKIADFFKYLIETYKPNYTPDISKINTYSELIDFIIKTIQSKRYVSAGIGGLLVRKVANEYQVLLYQRPKFPNIGKWSMPGGTIIHGDSIFSAIEKEYLNITGLRISEENAHILRITNHKEVDNGMNIHWLSPAYLIPITKHVEKLLKEIKNKYFRNIQNFKKINSDIHDNDWYVHPWEEGLRQRREEIFDSMQTAIEKSDNKAKENLLKLQQHGEFYRLQWHDMKNINNENSDSYTFPTIRAVDSFNQREKVLGDLIDKTCNSLRQMINDSVKEITPTDHT